MILFDVNNRQSKRQCARVISRTQCIIFRSSSAYYFALEGDN